MPYIYMRITLKIARPTLTVIGIVFLLLNPIIFVIFGALYLVGHVTSFDQNHKSKDDQTEKEVFHVQSLSRSQG
ncbi:MAG: hypothetical protein ACW99A_03065 [Candidatus Kariarchaeaceae archaeon]